MDDLTTALLCGCRLTFRSVCNHFDTRRQDLTIEPCASDCPQVEWILAQANYHNVPINDERVRH